MSEQISMDAVLDAVRGDLMVRQTVIAGTSYVSVEAILGVLRRHGWDRPDAPVTAGGTVTEWGVRLVRRDGVEQVQRHTDEHEARASHAVNEQWFAEGALAWCNVWQRSEVVSRQVTAWTVVDGPTGEGGA